MTDSAAEGSEQSARSRGAPCGAGEPCSAQSRRQDAAAAKPGPPGSDQQRACRVPGCSEPLKSGYGSKYRICALHYAAPRLVLDGVEHRFCQQCGQVHLLSAFDEERRSCRESLRRHQDCRLARKRRARQRAQQTQREAGTADAAPKKAAAPKTAPAAKPGKPKAAPAKAVAAGEATTDAAAAEAAQLAKRKRQAKGPTAGSPRPGKQQKLRQQGTDGQPQEPQPQHEDCSDEAGVPSPKGKRSEAAPSSDGSTQDRLETCREEPSLPLTRPRAWPASTQRAHPPAAAPSTAGPLPQRSCSRPLPPADQATGAPAGGQTAGAKAAAEPAPAAPAQAPQPAQVQPRPGGPQLSEQQRQQRQVQAGDTMCDTAPGSSPWDEWQHLVGRLEQDALQRAQHAQHGPARQGPQPQPLLVCQALELMETSLNGPPDVPSMHELLLLSTRMGFDLLPSERFLAHFDQHQAGWPASQPQLQTQLAAAAAARSDAASRAPPAAIKGRCMAPAASTLREAAGCQRGPETPTSAEQVPSRVTLMQRQESDPAGTPSLHVYEVTRSSQRCCWQLSCEFTAAGAEARCY